MLLLALIAGRDAHAQACVCSRNVALPSGNALRPWAGIVSVEYGASLSGEPSLWQGAAVTDRYGDSMAGMFMPPHLVQTGSLTATLGLPEHFSVSATLPYIAVHHLVQVERPLIPRSTLRLGIRVDHSKQDVANAARVLAEAAKRVF